MTALDQLTRAINWSEQALRLFWRRFPKRNGVHFIVTFVAIGIAWVAIFIGQAVSPFDGLEPLFEISRSSQVLGAAVVSSALVYIDDISRKPNWAFRDLLIRFFSITSTLSLYLYGFTLLGVLPDGEIGGINQDAIAEFLIIWFGLIVLALISVYLFRLFPWFRAARMIISMELSNRLLPPYGETGWHLDKPVEDLGSEVAVNWYKKPELREKKDILQGIQVTVLFSVLAATALVFGIWLSENFITSPGDIGITEEKSEWLVEILGIAFPGSVLETTINYLALSQTEAIFVVGLLAIPGALLWLVGWNLAFSLEELQYRILRWISEEYTLASDWLITVEIFVLVSIQITLYLSAVAAALSSLVISPLIGAVLTLLIFLAMKKRIAVVQLLQQDDPLADFGMVFVVQLLLLALVGFIMSIGP